VRRKRKTYSIYDDEAVYDPWPQIDARLDLEKILAQLPEPDRNLILLYYIIGYSQQELATRLGVCQQTVSRRLQKIVYRMGQMGA